MSNIRTKNHIKITGYVTSVDHDKGNNVLQVAIETENFEHYIVADNRIGKELLNCVDQKVKVSGLIIGEYFDGSEIIHVNTYRILKK